MADDIIDNNDTIRGFDNSADAYHKNANIQKKVAERLLASLDPWKETLPDGPIMEVGCGTGFLSKGLSQLFPDNELILSDISQPMLTVCRHNMPVKKNVRYRVSAAEKIPVDEPTYAMTISSFAAQWFNHPAHTLARWLEVTQPTGLLLAAFPGNESFPEWKKYAGELGLPFTANTLPDTEEMVLKLSSDITQVDYYEDTIIQKFTSSVDFFRHLKNIGAAEQRKGRHLTPKETRLLINHWDEKAGRNIRVSWHVVFLAVKKNITG